MKKYNNYTEGLNNCDPNVSIDDSQISKFKWMIKEGKITKGSRVIEIGCGNGEFIKYVNSLGAKCTGITPSPDQVSLLTKQGLDVRLINIWNVFDYSNLKSAYDVVIMNGSTEHFLKISDTKKQQDEYYSKMFNAVQYCLDPNSSSKRCIITAIHFNKQSFAIYEKFQGYLLERTYGGRYAYNDKVYINCAKQYFNLVTNEDHTIDYYIWARKIWYNVYFGMLDFNTIIKILLDFPVFILNDPYYIHKILHLIFGTWSWQFDVPNNPLFAEGDVCPTKHLWLTFELK